VTGINIGGSAIPGPPPAGVTLFGGLGGTATNSDLYSIDSATGAATSIGSSGFGLTGLAFRPSDGVLFGVTSNNSAVNPRSLITVDPVTGAGTLVGALGVTSGIADISFRSDDALYGYTPSTRTLYTINTTTGAATQVSSTAIPTFGAGYGLAFDSADVLYAFPKGSVGAIYYIVDPTTGGLTAQPTLTGGPVNGAIFAACFDATDLCWITSQLSADTYLATVDVGTSVIAGVGITGTFMDALVVELP
jgi:hypothetical protein